MSAAAVVKFRVQGSPRKFGGNPAIEARISQAYDAFTRCHSRTAIGECALDLGVPKWYVHRRARELGLSRTKETYWSEQELELLKQNRFYSPAEIQRRMRVAGFQRSVLGILLKRKRLKLTTRNFGDGYTANAIADLLNIDAHKVTNWISRGLLRAEHRLTLRTQWQGGDGYWIRVEDLRAFIFAFPQEIDLRKVDALWFIPLLQGTPVGAPCEEEHF